MKKNKKSYQNKKQFDVAIIVIVILASCGFINFAFGLANPAAVYCDELGYQYIVQEEEGGQRGFCQFPDGSVVDEWKFFIGEEGKEFSYCQKQGFEIKTITSEQCQYASKCAVCILKNGAEVEVTELMGLNLKATLLPWDPIEPTSGATIEPEHKTNYFLYMVALIIFLTIVFVVYKKMKNRNDYYE